MLIDTHSHIFLPDFDQDRYEMISRAREAGIEKILMPNVDVSTIDILRQTVGEYPGYCYAMMGLHPTSIDAGYKKELSKIERALADKVYIAVGEIGIDLYWDKTYLKEQIDAFKIQLEWAKQLNLPVAIHSRESFEQVYSVLQFQQDMKGVLHSFGGTPEDALKIIKLGNFRMGVNGVVTFKNSGLRDTLKTIPLEYIVLETDAPYLAPVPYRGKRNEPAYVTKVAETLASVYHLPVSEVAKKTTENANLLFFS